SFVSCTSNSMPYPASTALRNALMEFYGANVVLSCKPRCAYNTPIYGSLLGLLQIRGIINNK
ncbi:MAG: hypothetical protein K2P65_04310, partial [Lachnospiraceae bacterium]|nr:hypothetical protein [Lachnospiraceae bacterium]